VVNPHLQGYDMAVNAAHRNQEPWGAGQRPPMARALGVHIEPWNPGAGVSAKAVDHAPRQCGTPFERHGTVAAAQNINIR